MPNPETNLAFLLVALAFAFAEFVWRRKKGLGYDFGSLGGNIGIMYGNALSRALTGFIIVAGLFVAYDFAPMVWEPDDWRTWVVGFFVLEFCYYWQHRFSHTIRWAWASHAVHHSTNEFTLPAAFRLSWFSTFSFAWLALMPMALLGFHPLFITGMLMANLRFQYFLHTEACGKLGPLEWVFNTPSHHRVHHGSNEAYLDKNYGGVLIIFDRLFGTFEEERDDLPVVYGLTKKLESNNPFVIVFYEWRAMFRDALNARGFKQTWTALFGRPSDMTAIPNKNKAAGMPSKERPFSHSRLV